MRRKDLPLEKRHKKENTRVGRLTLLGTPVGNSNPPATETNTEELMGQAAQTSPIFT